MQHEQQTEPNWEEIPAEEGKPIDLVLEGGGIKGIGLVGALSVLEEEGYSFKNIAGTSAGAIVAALIAVGYRAEELRKVIMELDFETFTDEDLTDRIPLVGKALSILLEKGIYEGERFKQWMSEMLSRRVPEGASNGTQKPHSVTFGDLPGLKSTNPRFEHRVQVIVSDLTTRDLLVLPHQAQRLGVEPSKLEVAAAVRMSTSIPIFFEPVWFPQEAPRQERHLLVDGGVLSNFPVWVFDVPRGEQPRWPTFGLRLFESSRQPLTDELAASQQLPKDESFTIVDYLKSLVGTMMAAHDRLALERADNVRTVDIPTLGVGTTQFDLSGEQKEALYQAGREAARKFLEGFDYEEHLRIRREEGRL